MTELMNELAELRESLEMPPLETISAREEVLLLLERLVKKYGYDYVYEITENGCAYAVVAETWEDGEMTREELIAPSCIVGHLAYLKAPHFLESIISHGANGEGIDALGDEHLPASWLEDAAMMQCMENLQTRQDKRVPWGFAVDEFRRELNDGPMLNDELDEQLRSFKLI